MGELRTLQVRFDTPIARWELPLLRGAIISLLSRDNTIYHNHEAGGLRYAYPLIQYRQIDGKAALVCVADGVDALGDLLQAESLETMIGKRHVTLRIEHIDADRHEVEMRDVPVIYQLSDWLPLNDKNYKLFERERGLVARVLKLQQILTGNILSMLKGVGIFVPSQLETEITAMTPMRSVKYKGVPLVTLTYSLPPTYRCPIRSDWDGTLV